MKAGDRPTLEAAQAQVREKKLTIAEKRQQVQQRKMAEAAAKQQAVVAVAHVDESGVPYTEGGLPVADATVIAQTAANQVATAYTDEDGVEYTEDGEPVYAA